MGQHWSHSLKTLSRSEAGVVSAEAVAVTAMLLVLTFVVAWTVLSTTLSEAISVVGEELVEWIETSFP